MLSQLAGELHQVASHARSADAGVGLCQGRAVIARGQGSVDEDEGRREREWDLLKKGAYQDRERAGEAAELQCCQGRLAAFDGPKRVAERLASNTTASRVSGGLCVAFVDGRRDPAAPAPTTPDPSLRLLKVFAVLLPPGWHRERSTRAKRRQARPTRIPQAQERPGTLSRAVLFHGPPDIAATLCLKRYRVADPGVEPWPTRRLWHSSSPYTRAPGGWPLDPCDDPEPYDEEDRTPDWEDAARVDPAALPQALWRLILLGDDPFLSMQATNLGLVDAFLNRLESRLMRARVTEDGTPQDTAFIAAQSQMWIFAAYALLRTWRQRAYDTVRLIKAGKVVSRLADLERPLFYRHAAREMRADQLRTIAVLPDALERLDADLRRTYVTFRWMEALRMALAKHEVPKVKNSVAFAPGYGRINLWNGSIDFETSVDAGILGTTSHRELAEGLRQIWDQPPQSWEELQDFDDFLKGPVEPSV